MSATTKGHGGASTRSGTSTTRGVSSGRETKDEELQMVKQVLAELHDFSGADGVDTSDWVLQVSLFSFFFCCGPILPHNPCCQRLVLRSRCALPCALYSVHQSPPLRLVFPACSGPILPMFPAVMLAECQTKESLSFWASFVSMSTAANVLPYSSLRSL